MDALAALRLQIEWGADEALDDAPVNRLRPPQAEAPQPARPSPAIPALPRAGPVARAQAAAAEANTLEALYRIVAGFTDCALATTATRMAWTDGDPASGLVILGEVPGPEEDLAGRPLVGPAGQLFGRMLASIGLTRADALLTNVVPWRPPGGRAPTEAEVAVCAPFTWRHLTLLRPLRIVTLGQMPARLLTGRTDTIRRLRGRWHNVAVPGLPQTIPTLPMHHPGALSRAEGAKKEAWVDLLELKRHLTAT